MSRDCTGENCPTCGNQLDNLEFEQVVCDNTKCGKIIKTGTKYIFVPEGLTVQFRGDDDPDMDALLYFSDDNEDFCSMKCLAKRIEELAKLNKKETRKKPKKKKGKVKK